MKNFTPKHLRRKGQVNRSGPGAEEKSKVFRFAKVAVKYVEVIEEDLADGSRNSGNSAK